MFPEKRRSQITSYIRKKHHISVNELSRIFNAHKVTIRNDLKKLQDKGILIRTHGGAVVINSNKAELSFTKREGLQVKEKRCIGEIAASMIKDGESIILDASTTALEIAKRIKDRKELTVITNGIRIALELFECEGITVFMPGGRVRKDSISLVGEFGEELLDKYNVSKGFFGAKGVTAKEGLTDVNEPEVQIKRVMVKKSKEVIAVVDYTKWNKVAFSSFASTDEVNKIITDKKAPLDVIKILRNKGVEVIIC